MFSIGLMMLFIGLAELWFSLTKRGRELSRGHNRLPLPGRLRKSAEADEFANLVVFLAGCLMTVVGCVGMLRAIVSWARGTP